MEFTNDLRRLLNRAPGEGATLDGECAARLWGALLDGALDDIEVGAMIAALAVGGEDAEALLGLHRALHERIARVNIADSGVVAIPASLSFGITESNGLIFTGAGFSRTAISSSANPNAPTSAGTSWKPPARSRLPNENL
jgi:hypothetical protein